MVNYSKIEKLAYSDKTEVYLAAADGINGPVVVKILKRAINPAILDRVMKLRNNHIPRIYDYEIGESSTVIIEEFADGECLEKKIQQAEVTVDACIEYFSGILEALEVLHACEPPIIHRDIKPSNIIITGKGIVKLIDFDASRIHDVKRSSGGDTVCLGTREYAPPEQFGFAQTDVRSDIYSAGIVLYEMYYNRSFDRKELQLPISRPVHRYENAIRDIISRCTKLDPDQRYSSVSELADDFNNIENYDANARPFELEKQPVDEADRQKDYADQSQTKTANKREGNVFLKKGLIVVALVAAIMFIGAGVFFGYYAANKNETSAMQGEALQTVSNNSLKDNAIASGFKNSELIEETESDGMTEELPVNTEADGMTEELPVKTEAEGKTEASSETAGRVDSSENEKVDDASVIFPAETGTDGSSELSPEEAKSDIEDAAYSGTAEADAKDKNSQNDYNENDELAILASVDGMMGEGYKGFLHSGSITLPVFPEKIKDDKIEIYYKQAEQRTDKVFFSSVFVTSGIREIRLISMADECFVDAAADEIYEDEGLVVVSRAFLDKLTEGYYILDVVTNSNWRYLDVLKVTNEDFPPLTRTKLNNSSDFHYIQNNMKDYYATIQNVNGRKIENITIENEPVPEDLYSVLYENQAIRFNDSIAVPYLNITNQLNYKVHFDDGSFAAFTLEYGPEYDPDRY